MSYSSYVTQQQLLERVLRLELMLALLIQYAVADDPDPSTRALLLNFAGVVHAQAEIVPA